MKGLQFSTALSRYAAHTNSHNPISSGNIDLLRKINKTDLSGRELSQLIANDPAITAKVLRVANSSYYGLPNRVTTVNHATSLLGVDQVRTLVQAFCFSDVNGGPGSQSPIFEPRQFAAHSLVVSILSGKLARYFGFQMLGTGEAEIGGLLHDIGKCVLAVDGQVPSREIRSEYQRYTTALNESSPPSNSLLHMEKSILGFTHAELGAWLAATWSLPSGVQEAIFYSHDSIDDCIHKEWASVITLADRLANSFEMTCLPTASQEPLHDSVTGFLEQQGKQELYKALPEALLKEIEPLKGLYNMVSEGVSPVVATATRSEVTDITTSPSRSNSPEPMVQEWMKFIPGLSQLTQGEILAGGLWLATFFVVLLTTVVFGLLGMWTLTAFSALVTVLVWCVSMLVI
jgi:HD-like signal output (HDOD) protein